MNTEQLIIETIATQLKEEFIGESTGHDWWHISRVWNLAKHIATEENANLFIVQVAALLHDVSDWKFNNGDDKAGGKATQNILESLNVDQNTTLKVVDIVNCVSYKGAGIETPMKTIEGKVVQDADRIDALGAIGIARTFAYGGNRGRVIYDPTIHSELHQTFEAYKKSTAPTINHFYEKLLLLKDRMNTETGKKIAIKRHQFMELYLNQFYDEWEGKL